MLGLDWLAAREAVNLGLFLADFVVLVILARALWIESFTPGWMNKRYNQAGAAFWVFIIGHTIVRGWGQFLLYSIRRGEDPIIAENYYHIAFAANIVVLAGLVSVIYVFARGRLWLYVLLGTGFISIADYIWGFQPR